MSWAETLSNVCIEIAQDMKDLRAWSATRDPSEGAAVTSRLIQHTVKELCYTANHLDPVTYKNIVDAAASVKQATLNLLQQYRSLGDDLTSFNQAILELAIQIKEFDKQVKNTGSADTSRPTSQPQKQKQPEPEKTSVQANSLPIKENPAILLAKEASGASRLKQEGPSLDEVNKIRESIKDTLKKINTRHEDGEDNTDMVALLKSQVGTVATVLGSQNEALLKQVGVVEELSRDKTSNLAPTLREMYQLLRDLERGLKKTNKVKSQGASSGALGSGSHEMAIFKEMKEMALPSDAADNYIIIKNIGEGASGSVFKASHKDTGVLYALKKIKIDFKTIENTMKEIKFMGSVKHPNALEFSGFFIQRQDSSQFCCLLIEFCDAGSVQDILLKTGKGIAENIILAISSQTFKGLEYLHKKNQVHRDIKSGNLLLTSKGEVKIADFGTAAAVDLGLRTTVIGSSFWMAPETIDGRGHDSKADIWSMGITLIEMAEKDPPNFKLNGNRMAQAILHGPSPSLKDPSKFSSQFVEIVTQCLIKDPTKRSSATQILQSPLLGDVNAKRELLVDFVKEIVEFNEKFDGQQEKPDDNKLHKVFVDSSAEGRFSKVLPNTRPNQTPKIQPKIQTNL